MLIEKEGGASSLCLLDDALKAKFAETDTDGSGALDATELHNLFEKLGKPGKKTRLFAPFYAKTDHVTKTGSGQT